MNQPLLQSGMRFVVRRNFWSVFERTFRVFTPDEQLLMFVKRPLMRLREEFVISEDEAEEKPLLRIKSQKAIAINHVFEITDAATGAPIGSVQKRGLRSFVRDRFELLSPDGSSIGYMEEQGASLLRRFLTFLPSKHAIVIRDMTVATIDQRFKFFTKEFDVEIHSRDVDHRFVLTCALLALMAEARREDRK